MRSAGAEDEGPAESISKPDGEGGAGARKTLDRLASFADVAATVAVGRDAADQADMLHLLFRCGSVLEVWRACVPRWLFQL